jgi:hypothetical protein
MSTSADTQAYNWTWNVARVVVPYWSAGRESLANLLPVLQELQLALSVALLSS